jgi:hypothetical protein
MELLLLVDRMREDLQPIIIMQKERVKDITTAF